MADRKSTIYDLEAEKIKEKIIIFAADTGGYTQKEVSLEIQASLDELTELIDTAGAEVVGRLVQNRDRIANDLYLGRGKVEELREMIYELGATGVCCDDELSPAQLMNLQDALDIKVMDRTMVILDILCSTCWKLRGQAAGGTCTAQVQGNQTCWNERFAVETWRWNRNERTRREEAGDRQTSHKGQDLQTEGGAQER